MFRQMQAKENVSVNSGQSVDRMETVVKKTIDLMELLVKSDANPEKVKFAAASLAKERDLILRWDENRKDPLRDVLYGLCECIEYAMVWYVNREEKFMNIQQVKKEEVINSYGENQMDNGVIIPSQHKTKELPMKKEKKKVKTEESDENSDGRTTTTSTESNPQNKIPKEETSSDDLPFCEVSDGEENDGQLPPNGNEKFLVNPNGVATKKRYRVKVELEDESDPMNEKDAKKSQQKTITPNEKKVPLKKPIIGLLDRWIRCPKDDKKEGVKDQ